MKDYLTVLYNLQRELHDHYRDSEEVGDNYPKTLTLTINLVLTYLNNEVEEMRRLIPWRPHKRNFNDDDEITNEVMQKLKEETTDIFHFALDLYVSLGVSSEEIVRLYIAKNKVNHQRQKENY
jgi:hypothetical protein